MVKKMTPRFVSAASGLAAGIGISHITDPHGGWSLLAGSLLLVAVCASALLFRRFRASNPLLEHLLLASLACSGIAVGILRHQVYWSMAHSGPAARLLLAPGSTGWVEAEGCIKRIITTRTDRSADFIMELKRVRLREGDLNWLDASGECMSVRLFSKTPLKSALNLPDWESWSGSTCAGDFISVTGRNASLPPEDRAETNGFDVVSFLVRNGLSGALHVPVRNLTLLKRSEPSMLEKYALRLRADLTMNFMRVLSRERAALARATVLGDRSALMGTSFRGKPVKDIMEEGGISHAMAVSGLHAGIVAGMLTYILTLCHVPKRLWPLLVIPLLAFYVLMTGFSPSSTRALLMTSITLVVLAVGKERLGVSALFSIALTGLIMLLISPLALLSLGFQLSFSAVLSLVLFTRPIERFLRDAGIKGLVAAILWQIALGVAIYTHSTACSRLLFPIILLISLFLTIRFTRYGPDHATISRNPLISLPRGVGSLVAAQGAVQLGSVLPYSIAVFGTYAVSGIIVNLFDIPLIGIFVPSALLAGLLADFPSVGSFLAWPFAKCADITGWLFLECGYWGSEILPLVRTGEAPGLFMPVFYLSFLAFCLLFRRTEQKINLSLHNSSTTHTHNKRSIS